MQKYDYCVFIARCQPLHKAHLKIVNHALVIAKKVIIVFGSHRSAPNVKNPWTDKEREEMLFACLDEEDQSRVTAVAVRDYPYNDQIWLAEVHAKVKKIIKEGRTTAAWSDYSPSNNSEPTIALIGYKKDASSFYLDFFHQWDYIDTGTFSKGVSATEIRHSFFMEGLELFEDESKIIKNALKTAKYKWREHVPPQVVPFLEKFRETDRFKTLQHDYRYILEYKAKWEDTPFPVTFTTVDTVVVKDGHVLLVRRKVNPGKGLLALPGGFINQHEWIFDAALRELREETLIALSKDELRKNLKGQRVFDNPGRSLRGRVITHCYYFKLPPGGDLPEVQGSDDAAEAFWMPLGDLGANEQQFFEDHLSIIQSFVWKEDI